MAFLWFQLRHDLMWQNRKGTDTFFCYMQENSIWKQVGICNQYEEFWKKKRCRAPPPVSWLSTVVLLDYFKTSQIQNLVFFHQKKIAKHALRIFIGWNLQPV